jgi:hypothetical protein
MGALLGAVLGVALALIVENAETSSAVAAPERERAAVLAASPSSTTPSASRAASSQDAGNANEPSGNQRGESADRADQRDRKADRNGDGPKAKADGGGRDKPGKGGNK